MASALLHKRNETAAEIIDGIMTETIERLGAARSLLGSSRGDNSDTPEGSIKGKTTFNCMIQ